MLPDITYVPRGAQLFRVVNHHCGEWSLIVGVELKKIYSSLYKLECKLKPDKLLPHTCSNGQMPSVGKDTEKLEVLFTACANAK
jgi:hypothetical protein